MKNGYRQLGFTLIEILLVLALVAIVFVAMVPLVSASMRERKLRAAAEDIAQMVRIQRAQAQNSGRLQMLEIREQGFFKHTHEIKQVLGMPRAGEFYLRYPGAKWQKPSGQSWEFSPTGMVTPLSIRFENGSAWMEVDFDMLTGRVAEERYAF